MGNQESTPSQNNNNFNNYQQQNYQQQRQFVPQQQNYQQQRQFVPQQQNNQQQRQFVPQQNNQQQRQFVPRQQNYQPQRQFVPQQQNYQQQRQFVPRQQNYQPQRQFVPQQQNNQQQRQFVPQQQNYQQQRQTVQNRSKQIIQQQKYTKQNNQLNYTDRRNDIFSSKLENKGMSKDTLVLPPQRNMGVLMPYPESSERLDLSNVNDKVKNFEKNEKNREKLFLDDIEDKKKNFYNDQKNRYNNFKKELNDFEDKYNPFKILNIDYDSTESEIKKAYRRLSKEHHPDRGGDAKLFNLITQSYIYLLQKIKDNKGIKSHNELQQEAQTFFESQDKERELHKKIKNRTTMQVDKNNFNNNKFNQIFEENRLGTVYDKGYGGDWDEDEEENENVVLNNKFSIDVFNAEFNKSKSKRNKNKSKQIVVIDEPEAQVSTGLNFEELGLNDIENFSSSFNENMNFTDYKSAYTKSNLEYDEKFKRKDYKNLDDIKNDRSNISYEMNENDIKKSKERERRQEEIERNRLKNLMAYDRLTEKHSNDINSLFIKR